MKLFPTIRYCNESEWKAICNHLKLDYDTTDEFMDYQLCKQGILFKVIRYKNYKEKR